MNYRTYKSYFYINYYQDENIFTDECGNIMYDIFTVITPQNLFMFRHDYGNNCFPMVGNPDILCEIILVPDEVCGLHEIYDLDPGDDYERIMRYEEAKWNGGLQY